MNNKQVAAHIDEVWCSQVIVLYTDDHRYVKLCAFNWKEAGALYFLNDFILFEILLQTYDQLQEKASVSRS